ncbi:hypothetical protein ACFLQK_02735 [bacterium]
MIAVSIIAASFSIRYALCNDEEIRRYSYTERRELLWDEGKPLIIRESGGTIYARGWKKDEIKIKAVKTAYAPQLSIARRNAALLRVAIESPHDKVAVRTVNPTLRTGDVRSYVDYSLSVPRGIDLDLKSVEGTIYALKIEGAVTVRTASGAIHFRDITGHAVADSETGDIFAEDCTNLASAKTVSGDIAFSIVKNTPESDMYLNTEGGNVTIDFVEETPLILVVHAGEEKTDSSEASITVSTEPGEETEDTDDSLETRKYYSGGGGVFIRVTAASGTVTIKTTPRQEENSRKRNRPEEQ